MVCFVKKKKSGFLETGHILQDLQDEEIVYISCFFFFYCKRHRSYFPFHIQVGCSFFYDLLWSSNQSRCNHYKVIILTWLVVWNICYVPIYWECHHPNWLIFSEGWPNHQPVTIVCFYRGGDLLVPNAGAGEMIQNYFAILPFLRTSDYNL